jgi:hypothetical protein
MVGSGTLFRETHLSPADLLEKAFGETSDVNQATPLRLGRAGGHDDSVAQPFPTSLVQKWDLGKHPVPVFLRLLGQRDPCVTDSGVEDGFQGPPSLRVGEDFGSEACPVDAPVIVQNRLSPVDLEALQLRSNPWILSEEAANFLIGRKADRLGKLRGEYFHDGGLTGSHSTRDSNDRHRLSRFEEAASRGPGG